MPTGLQIAHPNAMKRYSKLSLSSRCGHTCSPRRNCKFVPTLMYSLQKQPHAQDKAPATSPSQSEPQTSQVSNPHIHSFVDYSPLSPSYVNKYNEYLPLHHHYQSRQPQTLSFQRLSLLHDSLTASNLMFLMLDHRKIDAGGLLTRHISCGRSFGCSGSFGRNGSVDFALL